MNKITEALKLAEECHKALAAIREALDHSGDANEMVMDWSKVKQAARQALEALIKANHFHDYEDEITALREALSEQAEQEPLMDYERINALREGEQNGAEDAYFFARPENDTPTLRKMFCQGFERGFHKGLKYAAPVQQVDLTDDEIMDLVRDECVDMRWPSTPLFIARAVIAAFKEKNK